MSAPACAWVLAIARRHSKRFIVENATVLDDSAMAVIGVFVDADVGHDHQSWDLVLHRFDGPLHDAVRIEPRTPPRIFPVGNPKEDDGGNPQGRNLTCLFHQEIDRETELARHRANLLPPIPPFDDEQRINQVGRGQARLPHHATKCLMLPQPPEPLYWKGHRITSSGDSSRTPRGRAQKSCRPICHPESRRDGGYAFEPSDRWHPTLSYSPRSSRSGPT